MNMKGDWVYLGALKFEFNEKRFFTVNFAFREGIRTKALIFNLGRYNSPDSGELQLGQIKVFTDPMRLQI